MRTLATLALAMPLLALGCATTTKAKLLEKSFADDQRRHELFEANLEVLDRHPAYVDEFFAQARKHPRTLERFMENQSQALQTDEKLAAMTAEHLRAHPKALQMTMEKTLDAVERDGAARRAVANAMRNRAMIAADIVVEEEDALSALGKAMAAKAAKDSATRDNLREAVKDAVSDRAKK